MRNFTECQSWKKSPDATTVYSTLGWVLLLSTILGLFGDDCSCYFAISGVFVNPEAKFRDNHLFKSDTRTFFFVVAAALSVLILWRLHIFVHALVTISAAILVRLEAQESRLSNRQTFWIFGDCIPSWLRARCSSANCNLSQFWKGFTSWHLACTILQSNLCQLIVLVLTCLKIKGYCIWWVAFIHCIYQPQSSTG